MSTRNSQLATDNSLLSTVNWKLATVLFAYMALLAYASLRPISPEAAEGISGTRRAVNNLLHVPAYAVLAGLWMLVLSKSDTPARRLHSILLGGLIAVLFGAVMEALQGLVVPGRMCGWEDFGLNTLGAALAAAAMLIWAKRKSKTPVTRD